MTAQQNRSSGWWIWGALTLCLLGSVMSIALSPQLAYRQPIYIAASFTGGVAMALLVVQPVLAAFAVPWISRPTGRRVHRLTGMVLVAMVVIHIATLWITSPPDVIDALLLRSPTPFSIWGVIALWGVFLTAGLAVMRRKVSRILWRRGHIALAVIIALGTILHVILIDGTMTWVAKAMLAGLLVGVTAKTAIDTWSR